MSISLKAPVVFETTPVSFLILRVLPGPHQMLVPPNSSRNYSICPWRQRLPEHGHRFWIFWIVHTGTTKVLCWRRIPSSTSLTQPWNNCLLSCVAEHSLPSQVSQRSTMTFERTQEDSNNQRHRYRLSETDMFDDAEYWLLIVHENGKFCFIY